MANEMNPTFDMNQMLAMFMAQTQQTNAILAQLTQSNSATAAAQTKIMARQAVEQGENYTDDDRKVQMFSMRRKDWRKLSITRINNGEPDIFIGKEFGHDWIRRVDTGKKDKEGKPVFNETNHGASDKVVVSIDVANTPLGELCRLDKPGRWGKERNLDLTLVDDKGEDRSEDLIEALEMAIELVRGTVAARAQRAVKVQQNQAVVQAAEELRQRAVEVE